MIARPNTVLSRAIDQTDKTYRLEKLMLRNRNPFVEFFQPPPWGCAGYAAHAATMQSGTIYGKRIENRVLAPISGS